VGVSKALPSTTGCYGEERKKTKKEILSSPKSQDGKPQYSCRLRLSFLCVIDSISNAAHFTVKTGV